MDLGGNTKWFFSIHTVLGLKKTKFLYYKTTSEELLVIQERKSNSNPLMDSFSYRKFFGCLD